MSIPALVQWDCDNCGEFFVIDEEHLTMLKLDDEHQLYTKCPFCDAVITSSISDEDVIKLHDAGVNLFTFREGASDD